MNQVEFEARCKAFSDGRIINTQIMVDFVDGDGAPIVRVYDPIAGHYTTCHALSQRTQRNFIRMARKA
ncbi:MAG: hypothetical protein EOM37_17780 [Proteobacteria bacterium]|nr:hypothetical protein [Pseudomonadota bacterium]